MNPLSGTFGAIVAARNAFYDRGIFRSAKLQGPVISVGNISLGGAGKTPFVIALGKALAERGIEFDILTRGYGRKLPGTLQLPENADALLYGDEPTLLQQELHAPVFLGASRAAAGEMAEKKLGPRIHLMDDAFQHRALKRDYDIVALMPEDFEGRLLPVGRLREPLSSLKRADAVVLPYSYFGDVPSFSGPVWRVRRHLEFPQGRPERAVAFCAIAHPARFYELLKSYEIEVVREMHFADHHKYTDREIADLLELADASGVQALVTTAKDVVKLERTVPPEFLQRLRVARLITEIEDKDRVLDQILATVQKRCPAWKI